MTTWKGNKRKVGKHKANSNHIEIRQVEFKTKILLCIETVHTMTVTFSSSGSYNYSQHDVNI